MRGLIRPRWCTGGAGSERPHRVNEAIRLIVEQTGVLAGRRRRAVDSTILADAVATQDTITQLVSTIRRVARELPGAGEQIAAVCTGHDYSKPGKPKIDWDDPAAKDALVSALVSDANALVEAFRDAELDEAAASAVALLALVAGQDVEPAEGSDGTDGLWRIARKVAEDRVISTVDPDARHTRKSPEARRDGYRAHLAADPETGIITDEKLTRASGTENSDPAVAEEFLAAGAGQGEAGQAAAEQPPATGEDEDDDSGAGQHGEDGTGREPLAWYGDSAYGNRGPARRDRRRGPCRGDQAQAAASPGRRRVHRRSIRGSSRPVRNVSQRRVRPPVSADFHTATSAPAVLD